ncbi:MAG: ATP-binding protein, partial [Sandaracinaceae bacterium]
QSQKMESVGRFAGGVAHDFNNVLTAILFGTEDARGLRRDDPALADSLTLVEDASRHAARLTKQLLTFSRRDMVQPRAVDVNEVVAESGRLWTRLVSPDLDLQVETHPEPLFAYVDDVQLQQVLLNLVLNAKDAMPMGGALRVVTRHLAGQPVVHGRTEPLPRGDYVALQVSDTGVGMDEETLGCIFEPFFTTKPSGIGTGLGLFSALGIVEEADGGIAVESAPGRGTTFSVYLPQLDVDPQRLATVPSRDEPSGRGETILVVDDDLDIRALVCRALQSAGYRVLEAGSGRLALALLDERGAGRVDLLLTDVVMPTMGGPDLAAAFRQREPEGRVLYLSGYVADARLARAVADGHARLLSKPFTRRELLEGVRDALAADPSAPREPSAPRIDQG